MHEGIKAIARRPLPAMTRCGLMVIRKEKERNRGSHNGHGSHRPLHRLLAGRNIRIAEGLIDQQNYAPVRNGWTSRTYALIARYTTSYASPNCGLNPPTASQETLGGIDLAPTRSGSVMYE